MENVKKVPSKSKFLARLSSRVKPIVKQELFTGDETPHAKHSTDQGQHTETELVTSPNATEPEKLSNASLDLDEIFLQPELEAEAKTGEDGTVTDQTCNQFGKYRKHTSLPDMHYFWTHHSSVFN